MRDGSSPETGVAEGILGFQPRSRRRILCVFPRYENSFGTFNHAFVLMGGVRAFMPPQGILLVAALLPKTWQVRLVDENIRRVTARELQWADTVFVSGMHIQRERIQDIIARAHEWNKTVVLGGPSVSSAPHYYPEADIVHCGEAGDATLKLFARLDEDCSRPERQILFKTVERMSLDRFPPPAYGLADLGEYLMGSIQFSSGCPFTCEFCDIPALYGRNPRLKSPRQIVAELDVLADGGVSMVYFVDDNFVGNPKAARDLLPHLIAWQKRRGYNVRLSCEGTLNIGSYPDLLEMMREANFITMFCGIETPEPEALRAMHKTQNLRIPILEVVDALNRRGIEVAGGIIMGLDSDDEKTAGAILDFARVSAIPILTVNLLYALPHTPLHARLESEGRINSGEGRDSNVDFLRGYDAVHEDWRRVVMEIYSPESIYRRFARNCERTYSNRWIPENPWAQLTWANVKRGLSTLFRIFWHVGVRADYRRHFWKMAWREGRKARIGNVIHIAFIAHHLITYARECAGGLKQASNYSPRVIEAPAGA